MSAAGTRGWGRGGLVTALAIALGIVSATPVRAQAAFRVDEEVAIGVGVMAIAAVGGGLPMGIPPAEPDPMMDRILPEKCYLYVSWQGTAEPDPDSSNHTEALLAEPEVQHMLAEVERAIRQAVQQEGRPPRPGQPNPEDLINAFKTLLTRPATIYVGDFRPSRRGVELDAGIVVNVGDQGEVFERLLSTIPRPRRPDTKGEKEPAAEDRTWHTIDLGPGGPPVQWAVKGEHLIVGIGEGVADAILKRAETPAPAWVEELHNKLGMDRPANILHVNDLPALIQTVAMGEPEVYQVMRALGLSDVQSITSATGLDEKGCVTRLLIALDGQPRGLLSLFNAKPLTNKDLEMIPRDATIAAAVRFDLADAFDTFLDVVGRIEPRAEREILGGMGEAEMELGFSFRRDLFAALGDTWRVYNSPGEGGLIFTGATAVVAVRDAERLRDVNRRLIDIMRREMGPRSRDYGPEDRPYYSRRRGATIEEVKHQGQTVYFLNVIGEDEMPFTPAWCITDDELVVALFPQQVKVYLDRKASGSVGDSLDMVPEVAALFGEGDGPLGLVYVDTPELFELGYPMLQILAQLGCSELQAHGINVNASMLPSAPSIARHLRPDVVAVRRTEAGILVEGRRTVAVGGMGAAAIMALPAYVVTGRGVTAPIDNISRNNLKQIGLALHNYYEAHNRLPGNIYSKDGKPLLSWRVQILPYIEQTPVYEQFHLDEPWDSPHNRRLAEIMVPVYRIPGTELPPGHTTYLGVAGKDGLFAGKEGATFAQVHDGLSNTIAVVQAADSKAVPWTKPDDLDYNEDKPFAGLVNPWDYRFNALLGDGSVYAINETIDPRTLSAMFTKSGGEIVDTHEVYYGRPRPRSRAYDKVPPRAFDGAAPYRGEKVESPDRPDRGPEDDVFRGDRTTRPAPYREKPVKQPARSNPEP